MIILDTNGCVQLFRAIKPHPVAFIWREPRFCALSLCLFPCDNQEGFYAQDRDALDNIQGWRK